ncbi:MAG: transcriptional repressor [Bacteroidaceae bacterium]|nr:transcriptional repressor [Bacteroidaceae bacterium]
MEAEDKIKEAGLKLTPQRVAVYKAMMALRHAQVEDIVDYIKVSYGSLTLSTVYRVLESFCNVGLLSLVCHPETGECYYDITVRSHHHVFRGERIIDLDDEELTALVREYVIRNRPDLTSINRVQVQITLN